MMERLRNEAERRPSRWLAGAGIAAGLGAIVVAGIALAGGPSRVEVTIPAGTAIVAELGQSVSTERAEAGDELTLRTTEPIPLGEASLPAGTLIRGEVTHARGGGRVAGAPELTIRFRQIESGGETRDFRAEPFRVRGRDDALQSGAMIGGGAVAGGVVGAIAGNVAAGAVAGAVLGTGVAVATEGDQIVLPRGQRLRVRIAEPVTIRVPAA